MERNRYRALAERVGSDRAAPVPWAPTELPEGALPLFGWVGVSPETGAPAAHKALARRHARRRPLGLPGR